MDILEDCIKGKVKFKVIVVSIGNGGVSEINKSVNFNVKIYEKVFERFNFN